MDAVSKINRHRALRQVNYIAIRGKDENLIRENIHLQCFQILGGVIHLMLQVHHLPQPGNLFLVVIAGTYAASGFLVLPVGCHAVFGNLVHGKGTNLDFQRVAPGHDRGMQGLVAVGLGHGDIVLEPARDRLPHGMDNPQHRVAVLYIVHQHPDS